MFNPNQCIQKMMSFNLFYTDYRISKLKSLVNRGPQSTVKLAVDKIISQCRSNVFLNDDSIYFNFKCNNKQYDKKLILDFCVNNLINILIFHIFLMIGQFSFLTHNIERMKFLIN